MYDKLIILILIRKKKESFFFFGIFLNFVVEKNNEKEVKKV